MLNQQMKSKILLENNGIYDFKILSIGPSQYSEPGRPKLTWKFITVNKYGADGQDEVTGKNQYINFFDTSGAIKGVGDNFIVHGKGKTNFRTTKLGRVIRESGLEDQVRSLFGGMQVESEEQRKQLFELVKDAVLTIRVTLNDKGFPSVFTFSHEEE